MYLPKMNLISLSSFKLCFTQIYNTHTHTHARTHAHTHAHAHTHTCIHTYIHTEIFKKTHISTQGARKYRKSSQSQSRKISPLQSFLFEKAKYVFNPRNCTNDSTISMIFHIIVHLCVYCKYWTTSSPGIIKSIRQF